mmetsp:Transcript_27313/g.33173  ORF Transcript_27313/g.33173 Transcript_27313/m.33173 type:complete len:681 (-) Transcript_27313:301-2343(-)|eukprot:CAMPEP_0197855982 /NCGR_PEP_ID=MMETSP1438-20131217/27650_1 /TAXON_ID=1461541 /ORGANISM="Pterosperma sp., Strain CCMP1384" /LENGTH=680 /DNA_ID=CAMNT_0043471275 /DNA_START=77 /DNA_END=2119 /DNA_ORIENTATION=+
MTTKPSTRDPNLADVFGEQLVNIALGAPDVSDRLSAFQKVESLIRNASINGDQVTLGWTSDTDLVGDEPARMNALTPSDVLTGGLGMLAGACKDADVPAAVCSSLYVALLGSFEEQPRESSSRGLSARESSSSDPPPGPVAKGPGDSFANRMSDNTTVWNCASKVLLPELTAVAVQDIGLHTRTLQLLLKLAGHPAGDPVKMIEFCVNSVKGNTGEGDMPPLLGVKLLQQILGALSISLNPTLLERAMSFLVPALKNEKSGELKKAAVSAVAEVYRSVRKRINPFLKELPSNILADLEPLFAAFDAEVKSSSRPSSVGRPPSGARATVAGDLTAQRIDSSADTGTATRTSDIASDASADRYQVEPTKEMVLASCGQMKRNGNEPLEKFFPRVTHLTLDNRKLTRISNLRLCTGLRVLYLYDNQIKSIENLDFAHELTHLYLQNNQIESLEGVGALKRLQKLYLDGNRIKTVSGLDGCERLEEIHINKQKLGRGEGLTFDMKCMRAVSGTLCVLKASQSGVSENAFPGLSFLRYIEELDLSNNNIKSIDPVLSALENFRSLHSLDIRGNPVCKLPKYRNEMIVMAQSVRVLDGKDVSGQEREFLLRLMAHKKGKGRSKPAAAAAAAQPGVAALGGGMAGNLPPRPREMSQMHSGPVGSKRQSIIEPAQREIRDENGLSIGL